MVTVPVPQTPKTSTHRYNSKYEETCLYDKFLERDGFIETRQLVDICTGEEYLPYKNDITAGVIGMVVLLIFCGVIVLFLIGWATKEVIESAKYWKMEKRVGKKERE